MHGLHTHLMARELLDERLREADIRRRTRLQGELVGARYTRPRRPAGRTR